MLAFAIPAMFTGVSFYWLKLSDRYFLLHYQGKSRGRPLHGRELAQRSRCTSTLMAFRMAWPQWHYAKLTSRRSTSKMVSRSSTYFIALNGMMLVAMGVLPAVVIHTLLNEKFW